MKHIPSHSFVPAPKRPGLRQRLLGAFRRAWGAYLRWLAREAARRTLMELDDRMLKDIGISRGEIEAVARGMVREDRWRPPPGLG